MKVKSRRQSKKTRRSAEQWQETMLAYEESGLTQAAFCARESLAPNTFHKWRQHLASATPVQKQNSGHPIN